MEPKIPGVSEEKFGFLGAELQINRVIAANLRTTDRFQAALLAVAFGNASPDAILELAERGEEAKLQ